MAEAGRGDGERLANGLLAFSLNGSWRTPGKVWPGDAIMVSCMRM